MNQRFKLLLFYLFILMDSVNAQQVDRTVAFRRLDARNIGTERCSYQYWDKDGACWFVGDKGLIENNGYRSYFYHHDPTDQGSILNDTVQRMFGTGDNEAFISYESVPAISILNTSTKTFEHHHPNFLVDKDGANVSVTAIKTDHLGDVYVMTWGNGMHKFNRETKEFKRYSLALESDSVFMNSRPKDFIRLNEDEYLVCFFRQGYNERGYPLVTNINTGENYELPVEEYLDVYTGSPLNIKFKTAMRLIHCAHLDREKNLWFGTYSGLFHLDFKTKVLQRVTNDKLEFRRNVVNIRSMIEVNGELWCGSPNMGIVKIDMKRISYSYLQSDPFNPVTLFNDRVISQCKDQMGNLWVCSEDGMVSIYVPSADRFKVHSWKDMGTEFSERSHQVIPVNQMLVEKEGTVLISSGAGLQRFSPKLKKTVKRFDFNTKYKLQPNVYNFKVVGDSILFMTPEKISYYNEVEDKFFIQFDRNASFKFLFRHSHPYKEPIFFQNQRMLKIQQLFKLDSERNNLIPFYTFPEGVKLEETFTLELKSERWLISEKSGRFVIFDPEELTHELYSPSQKETNFPDSTVRMAHVMNDRILIGTEKGLYEFDEETKASRLINSEIGLGESEIISAMVEDRLGRLWIALEKDLVCWNEKTGTLNRYSKKHGLNVGAFLPAIGQIDGKGYLYLATINGLLVFNPMSLEVPDLPMEVGVLDIIVQEDTLYERNYAQEELNLHWNDDVISFQFYTNQVFQLVPHKFEYRILEQGKNWISNGTSNKLRFYDLPHGSYTLQVRATNGFDIKSHPYVIKFTIRTPYWLRWWFYAIISILLASGIWYYIKYRERALKKRSEELEITVKERTSEVVEQKREADRQREMVEEKQQEITDSITYAKRIQDAILPPAELIKANLPNAFVLYRPKDIVAGDFYWLEALSKDKVVFASADCTGHGVPGAMVSVVCNNAMNRTVREFNITEPGKLLDKVRELVVEQFDRSNGESKIERDDSLKDGMDISLCNWDKKTNELEWSGAHNPLWLIRNGELLETKGNKQPVGKFHLSEDFTTHKVLLEKGDRFYLITDGYADQFGGEKGKKFKSSNLKKLLVDIHQESIENQKKLLEQHFDSWKGNYEQLDDVCIVGVEV